jgi:hypothetical protein
MPGGDDRNHRGARTSFSHGGAKSLGGGSKGGSGGGGGMGGEAKTAVASAEEALSLLWRGLSHRVAVPTSSTSSTSCETGLDRVKVDQSNRISCSNHSSRGHSVFTIFIGSKSRASISKFIFIDLADCSKLAVTDSIYNKNDNLKCDGHYKTAMETHHINLSLLALGDVIQAISNNIGLWRRQKSYTGSGQHTSRKIDAKFFHVPYLDSKLTKIIGDNTEIILIATIQPDKIHFQNTLRTLNFINKGISLTKIVNHKHGFLDGNSIKDNSEDLYDIVSSTDNEELISNGFCSIINDFPTLSDEIYSMKNDIAVLNAIINENSSSINTELDISDQIDEEPVHVFPKPVFNENRNRLNDRGPKIKKVFNEPGFRLQNPYSCYYFPPS